MHKKKHCKHSRPFEQKSNFETNKDFGKDQNGCTHTCCSMMMISYLACCTSLALDQENHYVEKGQLPSLCRFSH